MNPLLRSQLPMIAGAVGGLVTRQLVRCGYDMFGQNDQIPLDPDAEDTTLRQVILWTAVLAAAASVGSVVARYVANQQLAKQRGSDRSKS